MLATMRNVCLLGLGAISPGIAAPPAVDFVEDVRPILQRHCYDCHSEGAEESGLRLDRKASTLAGGDFYGAAVIPGKPEASPLVQFVADPDADLQMPPDGERLTAAEIAVLRRWVRQGALWPDGTDDGSAQEEAPHWAFEPIAPVEVPTPEAASWVENPIDAFIMARLEAEGWSPAAPADRRDWLRRVALDLTGLPPSPEQVTAFVDDPRPGAYARIVDQLLASPRYGERWAQHWLDVVRYADTHGFEVNTERPHAWPYRDYVIAAFNRDTPYDRFVQEQLVGDALGRDAATGFLVTASVLLPGQIGKDEPSKRLARQDAIDEIVVNIGQTFLGLSIGCARCHNHKFDPISQRDYYEMQAFVAGVEYGDRQLRTPEAEARRREAERVRQRIAELDAALSGLVPRARSGVQRAAVNARRNTDRFTAVTTKQLRFTVLATNKLEPCLDELEVFTAGSDPRNVALATAGTTLRSSGDTVVANRHELRQLNDGVYGNSNSWMSNEVGGGWVELSFTEPVTIDRVVWGRDREGKFDDRLATDYRIEIVDSKGQWQTVADAKDRIAFGSEDHLEPADVAAGLSPQEAAQRARFLTEKNQLEAQLPESGEESLVFAGVFRTPDTIHLLRRGDPEQPQERVQPAVLDTLGRLELPPDTPEQQRRQALADWIAASENPLTARVMVNRIWQGHFGTGLVATSSDFGRSGAQPSHPELLDWLAEEFVRSGWSVKHLHRLIVLSATYGQSTAYNAAAASRDADTRLLWRFPPRRLEAEAIRDGMLAVSGQLNLEKGGRGFNLFDKRGGLSGFQPVATFGSEGHRRMVYAHKVRRERDAVFGAFDCPDNGQSTSRRRQSTTPIQALNLFNSRFTLSEAEAFARHLERDIAGPLEARIVRAFQLVYGRHPADTEIAAAEAVAQEHGLATLCRVLLNSNEFLFLP